MAGRQSSVGIAPCPSFQPALSLSLMVSADDGERVVPRVELGECGWGQRVRRAPAQACRRVYNMAGRLCGRTIGREAGE